MVPFMVGDKVSVMSMREEASEGDRSLSVSYSPFKVSIISLMS